MPNHMFSDVGDGFVSCSICRLTFRSNKPSPLSYDDLKDLENSYTGRTKECNPVKRTKT